MITIFSIESDQSTNQVIDWLNYYNVNWQRINAEDFEADKTLRHSKDKNVSKKNSVVWFRKWNKATDKIQHYTENSYTEINKGKEFEEYSKYLFNQYHDAFWLNHPDNWKQDKLTQLDTAKKIGLDIPPTIFTNNKSEFIKFKNVHKKIITKTLAATLFKEEKKDIYLSYTRDVTDEEIAELKNWFYPTLFQKKIRKKYEIRTFYLDGEFYSMAIFSQNDSQTVTDFRRYNFNKPNRFVPFNISIVVENKLRQLMKELKINCGSLDLIKDINGNYIFLEINPLGQFGMTSHPCNYQLEMKIAKLLMQKFK